MRALHFQIVFVASRRLDLALCVLYKGLGNFGCRAPVPTYMYSETRWLAHFRCRFIGGVCVDAGYMFKWFVALRGLDLVLCVCLVQVWATLAVQMCVW